MSIFVIIIITICILLFFINNFLYEVNIINNYCTIASAIFYYILYILKLLTFSLNIPFILIHWMGIEVRGDRG